MASNPPFEVEDQTDADFFDKLVEDDDNDIGGVTAGVGTKGLECEEEGDGLADGSESDELKALSNLSIGVSRKEENDFDSNLARDEDAAVQNTGLKQTVQPVEGSSSSVTLNSPSLDDRDASSDGKVIQLEHKSDPVRNETGLFPSSEVKHWGELSETSVHHDDGIVGDIDFEEWGVQETDQVVENSSQSDVSNSFSFHNGNISDDPAVKSEIKSELKRAIGSSGSQGSGIKEVNWSAFGGTADVNDRFGSYSDFFSQLGTGEADNSSVANLVSDSQAGKETLVHNYSHSGHQVEQVFSADQSTNVQDPRSIQYWESQYPGWKYDPHSGQWYQVAGYDAATSVQQHDAATQIQQSTQESYDPSVANYWGNADVSSSQSSYAQQLTQSVSETENASDWNYVSQMTTEYPAHMIFDPQYPGWYYDSVAQEWRPLEAYHSTQQSYIQPEQQVQNGYPATHSQVNYPGVQNQGQGEQLVSSDGGYEQQGSTLWPHAVTVSDVNHAEPKSFSSDVYTSTFIPQQKHLMSGVKSAYESVNHDLRFSEKADILHSSLPDSAQQLNVPWEKEIGPAHLSADNYGGQNYHNASQQLMPNGYSMSYSPMETRSSAGRPPHALVTFGFGGKLVVMKDNSDANSLYGSKDAERHSISILNFVEVVSEKLAATGINGAACGYFHALCHQSFSGPLCGGSVGSKEMNKWIDERISDREAAGADYGNGKALKLLLSLLKIACQHYGKLRSHVTNSGIKESDTPESAVAKLFSSAEGHEGQFGGFGTFRNCLMHWPSEAQIQATASELQNLLVSGRKIEALQCAKEGQWWSFALILARELGDQVYADTVKQMALSQLVAGTPLRTLSLLIAKNPEAVFSADSAMAAGGLPGSVQGFRQPSQPVGNSMLDNWAENLAVITANRTENDHLVITHLGDCLWKEKGNITAAHICYLVAEADFESYSDSSRLCLIGSDHWSYPRTYASPEAIQRTELFEYAKVMGNPQFVLLPFQPYKILYAHMLAEVGKVSESLKYCQSVNKSLKTGRSPEVETWKQMLSSLEDRIKTHQQGGYAVNLAPARVVGKLRHFFDSTAQKVIGPPLPAPLTSQSTGPSFQMGGSTVSNSQSMMAIPSLTPSASMEPISQWAVNSNRMTMQNRSVSEPDIGRSPMQPNVGRPMLQPELDRSNMQPDTSRSPKQEQAAASNEPASTKPESKVSDSTGSSRSSRFSFGTQLLQKTVGFVFKPRQGRQAKLGDENKFYYDEKLKRWVEEGAEPPAEEPALAPPPTTVPFQNPSSGYTVKDALNEGVSDSNSSPEFGSSMISSSSSSGGFPSMPPTSNQFSARARMGVRSRYVDTFNKGSGSAKPANLFQAPVAASIKPANVSAAKFFVPTSAPLESPSVNDQFQQPEMDSKTIPESFESRDGPYEALTSDSFQKLSSPSMTMQRFRSVDNIANKGTIRDNGNGSAFSPLSRRTASWGGAQNDNAFSPPNGFDPGQTFVKSPLSVASESSAANLQMSNGNLEGDLQEVEL